MLSCVTFEEIEYSLPVGSIKKKIQHWPEAGVNGTYSRGDRESGFHRLCEFYRRFVEKVLGFITDDVYNEDGVVGKPADQENPHQNRDGYEGSLLLDAGAVRS